MAIAGLVLSIIGLASCFISWLYWLSFLALPISIAGLVLSCVARKKAADGLSTAGLVIGIIAVVPMVANIIAGGNLGALAFSGNSIIIVVGVLLETTREIESQLSTHHYKGFRE